MSYVARLEATFRRARRKYMVQQGARVLAAALALDLGYDLVVNVVLPRAPGGSLAHLPLLPVILVGVLALKKALRLRRERFALYLDEHLKTRDRFYSFVRFQTMPEVPHAVREAQARETCESVPFDEVARCVSPRIPKSLYLTAPLFAGIIVLRFTLGDAPLEWAQHALRPRVVSDREGVSAPIAPKPAPPTQGVQDPGLGSPAEEGESPGEQRPGAA